MTISKGIAGETRRFYFHILTPSLMIGPILSTLLLILKAEQKKSNSS